jgi:CCR4-NOT complex subunit CAF16
VVGANGAGKTCLLGCVGGVHKYEGNVNVLGKEAYFENKIGQSGAVELVGGINVWKHGDCTIVGERWQPRGDCKVSSMLLYVDGWEEARRDEIVERFGIDLDWKVNQLSDGKKRKVQLLLAFLVPSKVLLLDEVTTDLDVLARQTLLQWLIEESDKGVRLTLLSSFPLLPPSPSPSDCISVDPAFPATCGVARDLVVLSTNKHGQCN